MLNRLNAVATETDWGRGTSDSEKMGVEATVSNDQLQHLERQFQVRNRLRALVGKKARVADALDVSAH